MATTIDYVPSEAIFRQIVGGNYLVHFDKNKASLSDIEGINWIRPTVRGYGPDEGLPEGYEFRLVKISYSSLSKQYTVELAVDSQYYGDVTGYQAEIREQKAKIKELESNVAEADGILGTMLGGNDGGATVNETLDTLLGEKGEK